MLLLLFLVRCMLVITVKVPKSNLLIQAGRLTPQSPTATDPYEMVVYQNRSLRANFDIEQYPSLCCVPNNLTVYRAYLFEPARKKDQRFRIPFSVINQGQESIEVLGITVRNFYGHQQLTLEISGTPKQFGPESSFMVNHICPAVMSSTKYWTVVEVQSTFKFVVQQVFINMKQYASVKFQYQFLCDASYHPNRFDWSSIILIILTTVSISSLARFGKLYSFKILFRKAPRKMQRMVQVVIREQATGLARDDEHIFQGFFLTWYNALAYIAGMVSAVVLAIKFQERAERIEEMIVAVVATLMTLHFIDECLCQLKELKTRICWRLRTRHVCSVFLSGLIMFSYWFWHKPWFVSDMISICMMGSLSKIYKFICMKDAVRFLLPCMIVDIAMFIYVVLEVRYEWDSVAMRYFDTPLFFQIPYVHYIYKKKCAWVSIINVVFPGFFIGLAYRFDRCKGTLVYEIISFSGLFVGMILWLIFQSVYSLPLPLYIFLKTGNRCIFTQIPMIAMCAYFAWRRTEIRSLWMGLFYDAILLEPFKDKLTGRDSQNSVISVGLFAAKEVEMKPMRLSGSDYDNSPLVRQTSSGQMHLHSGLFEGLLVK